MNVTLILILRILGLLIAAAGVTVIFAASKIVEIRGLAEKKPDDPSLPETLSAEEKAKLKRESAVLDIKLRGLAIAAPGFILVLIAFR